MLLLTDLLQLCRVQCPLDPIEILYSFTWDLSDYNPSQSIRSGRLRAGTLGRITLIIYYLDAYYPFASCEGRSTD